MREKIIRPDRRRLDRRKPRLSALADAIEESSWRSRRVHCWDLEPTCTEERRRRCPAHFVENNCWDLWAAEYWHPGRRPCCHPEAVDCTECSITAAKFDGGAISVYISVPSRRRRQEEQELSGDAVCPYLYTQRSAHDESGDGEASKAFKCQRRPGVMLHSSYVTEVCSTREHPDCVFFGA